MTDHDSDRIAVDRPDNLERTDVTEEVDGVTIHITEGDREVAFDSEAIIQADETHTSDGEFVSTEVVLEARPDLMLGLHGARIDYTDGDRSSGNVPWQISNSGQTMVVIEAGKTEYPPQRED